MSKKAVELMFTGATTPYASYDSTKINLGTLIQQKTGITSIEKYVGPFPVTVTRPMEASVAIPVMYPHVLDVGNNEHWVFLADAASAAATRRIVLYRFNISTQTWSSRGFITLTYPTTTNHTIRSLRVVRHLYTTGTVGVSDTAVTGSGTGWQTARYAVGARIGFGSTDPNAITTWYYISAIGSDTSITLSTSAGTISSGTPYVIDEIRIYTANSNATAANGGLFVTKGINYDDFTPAGTTIPAATTVDNIKAVYWLADASTVLNTSPGGMGLGQNISDTSHIIYITNQDASTTLRIYKYDVREALSGLSGGKSTSAFLYRTGQQSVTGTISITNAARLATLNHGPGAGVSCLYLPTTTRVLRCPETAITNGSVSFISDSMIEVPTGGTNTFSLTNSFTSVEYISQIDRLIIGTTTSSRYYVTQYNTNSDQFDHVMFVDNKQIDQSTASINIPPFPGNQISAFSLWAESGVLYACRGGTAAANNHLFAMPIGADWAYAATTNQRFITPSISTPNCLKYSRISTIHKEYVGNEVLGLQTEPFRVYYRTTGITDNSGNWQIIDETGDISGVAGASNIQFMYEFRTIGTFCIPARLFGLIVTYEDTSTDSHFQPSVAFSSITNKRFAWRFSTAFGSTVPTLTVNLYNAVTNALLLTDTTTDSLNGIWEKSTDNGSTWVAYNTTDKGNDNTYIRYTPTSLADNIKVRAQLTQ